MSHPVRRPAGPEWPPRGAVTQPFPQPFPPSPAAACGSTSAPVRPRPAGLRAVLAAVLALVAVVVGACAGGDPSTRPDPLAPAPTVRPPGVSFALPEQLGVVAAAALTDASGLVASRRLAGRLWLHNDRDAGTGPLLYCVGFQGADCGVVRIAGADHVDWEDIAIGPGPRAGTDYIYVGDIGDDGQVRPEIVVYRLAEPDLPDDPVATATDPFVVEGAEALRLRYPDGSHDAESLLVHPASGDLYVVTRDANRTSVYVARAPFDPAVVTSLAHVADIDVGFTNARSRRVTAGDISPDGRYVALLTYAEAYELTVPSDGRGFDAVWGERLRAIHVPDRLEGEALAYRLDSAALITTNERRPANLHQIERKELPS